MNLDTCSQVYKITETIIGCAYRVHQTLGPGFLEKVYENALRIELQEAGLNVQQQVPIQVWYRGHPVGEYFADLLVEGRVIVEIKAVRELTKEHEVQLVHYLTATGIEDGLLINFGPSVEVKRKFRTFIPRKAK
ncbi:MAG: GxxExxY protein [Anaerolineae bacterium]|nr:GxxExxY protein [Anaerolineae bacterium]